MSLTPLQHWMRLATPEEQEEMAQLAGTSRDYLYQIASPAKHRGISSRMAGFLVAAAAKVREASPRRDILPVLTRADLSDVCAGCEYARACLGDRAPVDHDAAQDDNADRE